MKISKLSLRKEHNIDRQIKLYRNEIAEIINEKNGAKSFIFKSGEQSGLIRDFYEFYIDNQSLISIINKNYWNNSTEEEFEFFNSKVSCIGGYNRFWDEVYINILSKRELTNNQINTLYSKFKSNFTDYNNTISKPKISDNIKKYFLNNFLMYHCQDCGDYECGGIALDIKKNENNIIWTDHNKLFFRFNYTEYIEVFEDYLNAKYKK